MTTNGILILSHCGFSFLEDIIAALTERGLRSYVLSSLPLAERRKERLTDLRQKVAHLYSTEAHELVWDDVDHALGQLRDAGERVLACITVWEGYRGLMAHANARLGVPDLAPGKIDALRDKLALRNRLNELGLSQVRAQALTPELLFSLQQSGGRYFIKPVSGIASYGAFPLRAETTWDHIQCIRDEAKDDIVYRSALGATQAFLIEDYLVGREFSFELIVAAGLIHVVGIHEKCEVTEMVGTVLEDSCTSPPYSIDEAAAGAGIAWVREMFLRLDLDWGCFHVEARFDGAHWDLIEINPRVGGSLISHSVKALNGGQGVLEMWLDLLVVHAPSGDSVNVNARQTYLSQLASNSYTDGGVPPSDQATFFRVYFAGPGKVAQVNVRKMDQEPSLSHVLLKEGDEIANTAREVFLGQLLWELKRTERDATLPALIRASDNAIDVEYVQRAEPVLEGIQS